MQQQIDTSPLAGTAHPRLAFLVRQFHRAIEAQQRRDEEWIATFERVARDERVRRVIQALLNEKELSRHG